MSAVDEISPREFVARWPTQLDRSGVVLLDVREHHELELASLDFAVHIPMALVPSRLTELDSTSTIVVMCHSGGRSALVAGFLASRGFSDVMNLAGGIDAWAREVDDSISRY
jgi:rhodanese-related sulfurtransferase